MIITKIAQVVLQNFAKVIPARVYPDPVVEFYLNSNGKDFPDKIVTEVKGVQSEVTPESLGRIFQLPTKVAARMVVNTTRSHSEMSKDKYKVCVAVTNNIKEDDVVLKKELPPRDLCAGYIQMTCPPMAETEENIRALSRAEIVKCWVDEQVIWFIMENLIEDVVGIEALYKALTKYCYRPITPSITTSTQPQLEMKTKDYDQETPPELSPEKTLSITEADKQSHTIPYEELMGTEQGEEVESQLELYQDEGMGSQSTAKFTALYEELLQSLQR
ncbi:hypothetical protein C2S52_008343 [Perilla frutescens var. hirtella]|nr:hypothetical protein C2S52_008343 [Perilla frutescens var. hirtella]